MKFNSMFNVVHRKTFALPIESDVVRPDLSFSIQEIQKRFTIQQILIDNAAVKDNYLLSSDSNEFDSSAVNVRQNYDLVDAYADTHRLYSARKQFVDSIRNSKKTVDKPIVLPDETPKTETE